MLRVSIWMNMPSFHQSDLFRALSASEEVDLQVIFARPLQRDRLHLGWQEDVAGFQSRFLIEPNRLIDSVRLAWSQRDRIHIVNGLWAEPAFAAALAALAFAGGTYVIYSEAPDRLKSPNSDPALSRRSIFKEMLKAPFGKLIAPRAAAVLPVSRVAVEFFKGLGVREQAVYPFGYFRSTANVADNSKSSRGSNLEIVFVGRLIRLKGLDLLLEAMQPLFSEYRHLTMTVIGSGELQESFEEQVRSMALAERVRFEGVVSSDKIQARLAAADLVVLPSRGDGWGMVVNDALSVGVPVIVSDRCGAAELINNGFNGYVFRADDVTDLRRCLATFLGQRVDWPKFRAAAQAVGDRISAESAALYLIDCLKHVTGNLTVRPRPPWAQSDALQDAALPQ